MPLDPSQHQAVQHAAEHVGWFARNWYAVLAVFGALFAFFYAAAKSHAKHVQDQFKIRDEAITKLSEKLTRDLEESKTELNRLKYLVYKEYPDYKAMRLVLMDVVRPLDKKVNELHDSITKIMMEAKKK